MFAFALLLYYAEKIFYTYYLYIMRHDNCQLIGATATSEEKNKMTLFLVSVDTHVCSYCTANAVIRSLD